MNPKLGVEPKTCGRKSIYYSWIHVVFLLFCEVLRTLYTVDIPISVLETCPAKLQNYLFYTHSYHISMNLCVNLCLSICASCRGYPFINLSVDVYQSRLSL